MKMTTKMIKCFIKKINRRICEIYFVYSTNMINYDQITFSDYVNYIFYYT